MSKVTHQETKYATDVILVCDKHNKAKNVICDKHHIISLYGNKRHMWQNVIRRQSSYATNIIRWLTSYATNIMRRQTSYATHIISNIKNEETVCEKSLGYLFCDTIWVVSTYKVQFIKIKGCCEFDALRIQYIHKIFNKCLPLQKMLVKI